MRLGQNFFSEDAHVVAEKLLGKFIVRKESRKVWSGRIVEVEAYLGTSDRAAHSYGGRRTKRTEIMYAGGGHIYMFFVYGMHWQLNFTAGKKGEGQAVLIRALEMIEQGPTLKPRVSAQGRTLLRETRIANGPGKVARFLKVDGSFYEEDLQKSKRIWVEDRGGAVLMKDIVASRRIGVDYAKGWKNKMLRFYIKGNMAVSRK